VEKTCERVFLRKDQKMACKMFKTTLLVAPLLMGAMAAPSMAHSILIGGMSGDPTLGSVFFDPTLGTNAVIYSYEVDLTVGNQLNPGASPVDGFAITNALPGFVGGTETFTPSLAGSNFLLSDTGPGGTITGSYSGTATGVVQTQVDLGTLSFESTESFANPTFYHYTSVDQDNNGVTSGNAIEQFRYASAGSPIPTPLPAGFGSGIAGLALVGLVSVKLRRKAAV
jgi:hypothetical protein